MLDTVYLYVDGESHYVGSEKCWARIHPSMPLEAMQSSIVHGTQTPSFPPHPTVRLHKEAMFFWDQDLLRSICACYADDIGGYLKSEVERAVYVTSMGNSEEARHEAARYIRGSGFEPMIIQEDKMLTRQREKDLSSQQILIKPKGVDVALAVRALEDAHRDLFTMCFLVTSDADYLPLIHALRRLGKIVIVLGYKTDFTKRNPEMEFVPDYCFDLERALRHRYALKES